MDSLALPTWGSLTAPAVSSCPPAGLAQDVPPSTCCDDNDWKLRFDLLTEIQRACKFGSAWLLGPNAEEKENRPEHLVRAFDFIILCLPSLRSVLSRNAMLALDALACSVPDEKLQRVLLCSGSASGDLVLVSNGTAHFRKLLALLLARASSSGEKKFLQAAGLTTLVKVALINPVFADCTLAGLAKILQSANNQTSAATRCAGAVARDVLEHLSSQPTDSLDDRLWKKIFTSSTALATACLRDKLSEVRNLGRTVIALVAKISATHSSSLDAWRQSFWGSYPARLEFTQPAVRNLLAKELSAETNLRAASSSSATRPPTNSSRRHFSMDSQDCSHKVASVRPPLPAKKELPFQSRRDFPGNATGASARARRNPPPTAPPPLANNDLRRYPSDNRHSPSVAAKLCDDASIRLIRGPLDIRHKRSFSLCSHKRNLSLTTTTTNSSEGPTMGGSRFPDWINNSV